eukprot:12443041-Heterocapsa_arctica.AAC.1
MHQANMTEYFEQYAQHTRDIDAINQELEDLGWSQVSDHEDDSPVDSDMDDEPGLMDRVAEAERQHYAQANGTDAEIIWKIINVVFS